MAYRREVTYSGADPASLTPWTLIEFEAFMHAELPLVVISAAADVPGRLKPAEEAENAAYRALSDEERGRLRPRHCLIPGVRPLFQPARLPPKFTGYTATPVLVGDIMPWGDVISGTGRWYHAWDQLQRRLPSHYNMFQAVVEVREAMQRKWWDMGIRPTAEGVW